MTEQHDAAPAQFEISIIIKALNEEHNISRTLESALHATQGLNAEIILADSMSTDNTISIARKYKIKIVQLQNSSDRCCGIGAQLGYQHCSGDFILIIDGDMSVERDWLLSALNKIKNDSTLGGVGGIVDDVNLDNIEFRARRQRKPADMLPGQVDRLDCGGLYRQKAIAGIDYLTHRSLHSREELELGLRLNHAGWRMERLDMISIHHYGHTIPMWPLIKKRWHSRYANGMGELLRASFGKPWLTAALMRMKLSIAVIGWWLTSAFLGTALLFTSKLAPIFFIVTLTPPVLMTIKKRSIGMGLYSILSWCVDAAGLIRGVTSKIVDPRIKIASKIIQNG